MEHYHFMSNTGQWANTPCAPESWPGIICCPNTALIPRQGTQQSCTESHWHFLRFIDFSDCIHHHNLWRKELKSPSWSFTQKQLKTKRNGDFTACLVKRKWNADFPLLLYSHWDYHKKILRVQTSSFTSWIFKWAYLCTHLYMYSCISIWRHLQMFLSHWGWNISLKYLPWKDLRMLITQFCWQASAVSLLSCPTPYPVRIESWKHRPAMVPGLCSSDCKPVSTSEKHFADTHLKEMCLKGEPLKDSQSFPNVPLLGNGNMCWSACRKEGKCFVKHYRKQ